jgi:L-methionine (R)-S-oxide reductase
LINFISNADFMPAHEQLLREFHDLARTAPNADVPMQTIAERFHETMPRYNWVGFYLVDAADSGVLIVGPYRAENVRIPLNTGLCLPNIFQRGILNRERALCSPAWLLF